MQGACKHQSSGTHRHGITRLKEVVLDITCHSHPHETLNGCDRCRVPGAEADPIFGSDSPL